jgi:hypothetical protein
LQKLVTHFWVAIAGAGVVLLGLMGPWAKVISIVSVSVSGFDTGDGKVVACFALGAFLFLALYARGRRSVFMLIAAAVFGVLVTAAAAYDLFDISSSLSDVNSDYARASVGWGLYLTVIGGIAIVAGSLFTISESRKQRQIAGTTVAPAGLPPA